MRCVTAFSPTLSFFFMYPGLYIYDSSNNRATATVGGSTLDALTAPPLGAVGGEVYMKIGGIGSGGTLPTTVGASSSTTTMTVAQGVKAVATAGTPVRLVATTTLVDSVTIQAQKTVTTANTGNIYVGWSSTGGSNYIVITPGQSTSIQAPTGKKVDLNLIYIDAATNADAVAYTSLN